MMNTVAAIATPPGQGGIAVIRISGSEAYKVASDVFNPKNSEKTLMVSKGYRAFFGDFIFEGKRIDEGIALCFRAPHSYTGEDVVELSCHGGSAVSQAVLQACIQAGAMPAPAGEFTKRAVLNGRISLTQAEAVMDMISASSLQAVAAARYSISGGLYKKIQQEKQKLLDLAGHLTAYIDYPEEGVEELQPNHFMEVLADVEQQLESLIAGYNTGAMVRRGILTAIVGSPNVGKSTLFNLLSGFERAIVTNIAGTTRDIVRENVQIAGIPLMISDTAGLRVTEDIVEKEGIRRSYNELEQAGLILSVFDGSQPMTEDERRLCEDCKGKPGIGIINKTDLGTVLKEEELLPYFSYVISVSANQIQAREILEKAIMQVLNLHEINADTILIANERQLAAVVQACDSVKAARETLKAGYPLDAANVYLDDALFYLSELTGENVSEIVLENVFSNFCVGK